MTDVLFLAWFQIVDVYSTNGLTSDPSIPGPRSDISFHHENMPI